VSSPTVPVSAFKQIVYLSLKMISPHYNYTGHRNSYTGLNEIYFWTITINNWNHLLKNDDNKMIVISSLQWCDSIWSVRTPTTEAKIWQ